MNRQQKLDKIEKAGWYTKGLKGRISMISTVKQPQNRKFSFDNFTQGKK